MKLNTKSKYMYIRKCNICGENKKTILFKIGLQNLVKCTKCELTYLDKQRVDINTLYNENYYKNTEKNSVANYCDYESQEKVVKNKFKFAYLYIYRNVIKNKKLLEIGAGYGFFLKFLPKNLKFYAVEISKVAAGKITENNPNIKVYDADFIKTKIDDRFNYIVSFDVIEHQINLKKYLHKIYTLLSKDGIFIFTTPDYGSLMNKFFGINAPTIQPLYHNYYFNQKWIRENLPKLGFKIIYLKTTHFEPMNIGTILLYITFAVPVLKRIHLLKVAKFIKIENIIIPFFRFGGLECIAKRVDN